MAADAMDPRERALTGINTQDILAALGWQEIRFCRRWIELLFRYPARTFARQVLRFDRRISEAGIREAAGIILGSFVENLSVSGAAGIPSSGPALILSNHPGMTDTVALFAAIPRPDLAILAADRPFLRALRAGSRSLIFIPEEPEKRAAAVRRAVDHLKGGGALLTFPAGEIEPDPAVLPGAEKALARWSGSTALFVRLVPGSAVVPVVVSGVLSRRAQRHPLTRLRRVRADRERFGAMLQIVARILFPRAWPVRVRVDVLDPFAPGELAALRSARAVTAAVRERVARFLARGPVRPARSRARA